MTDIDTIMDMLDWNNPEEIQAQGRELAKNIKCLNAFILPYGKNVWGNCALILCDKTDKELTPFLCEILRWLNDINWPGSLEVWDRLLKYKDKAWLISCLNSCMLMAKDYDNIWLHELENFKSEYLNVRQ